MGSEFTFFDYLDTDGANLINGWLNGDGKIAKAHFNRMIGYLEEALPAGSQDSVWQFPNIVHLRDKWKGFIEIRKKVNGVQYRLIGKVEGRNVFMITWGYHKGRWKPDVTLETAKERVTQMMNNPVKHRREHDST